MHVQYRSVLAVTSSIAFVLMTGTAFAGIAAPAPLAGALGPVGALALGVGYAGYRIVKALKQRS